MRELTDQEVMQVAGGGNLVGAGIRVARSTGRLLDYGGRAMTAYEFGKFMASGYKNHQHPGFVSTQSGSGYGGYGRNGGRIQLQSRK